MQDWRKFCILVSYKTKLQVILKARTTKNMIYNEEEVKELCDSVFKLFSKERKRIQINKT